jgi:two-component system nitrate/nitrite response regulator NarL
VTVDSPPLRLTVCLLSQHSFVLSQFQKVLSTSAVGLESPHIEVPTSLQQSPSVPRASVYVVDGEGASPITRAMITRIKGTYSEAKLIVVAETFSENKAFSLLQIGVDGLVTYGEISLQLPRALQALASGGYWVPRMLLSRFVDSLVRKRRPRLSTPSGLSPREREITDALLGNLSNKEIATKLNISERTVKFHVSNILAKFGVRRRSDLILLWAQSSADAENKTADVGLPPGFGMLN